MDIYISGFHEKCLGKILEVDKEDKITVLLANHLFSKMAGALGKQYLVTNDHHRKFYTCPCESQRCREEIEYGSSGIGRFMYMYMPKLLAPLYAFMKGVNTPPPFFPRLQL